MNTSNAIAPHCELCAWIVANEAEIRSGGAEYQSVKVTEATEVVCYDWVASILVITLTGQTSHRFVDDDRGAGAATIITALFGWWGFPYGPFSTFSALMRNLRGGVRSNVATVIAQQRWGVTVQDNRVLSVQNKKLIDITPAALAEIENRRRRNNFAQEFAIKPVPENEYRRTCRIQFDYPVSDGRQFSFQSQGVAVVIEESDREYFEDRVLEFDGTDFVLLERHEVERV